MRIKKSDLLDIRDNLDEALDFLNVFLDFADDDQLEYTRNLIDKIQMVESCAYQADSELHEYLLRGVTEARTFENLKARLDIPCSRNTYYDRYRKFFWLLSAARN